MRHLNGWYPYEKPSRNKSSKQHSLLIGRKNPFRYVTNAYLKQMVDHEVDGAYRELQRRQKKAAKNNKVEQQ